MNVLITGGAGFLGMQLARLLLERGALNLEGHPAEIERLTILDVAAPHGMDDPRVRVVTGDLADPAVLADAIGNDTHAIFHLAAVVSGQAEGDFELGMRVNLDASRALLETCRRLAHTPRVLFTSSVAVYGGHLPAVVQADTALNPQSSYGMQKAVGELLLSDYSRRGFVDGRVVRLPTISVRPGKPNAAASSFASGIIREPVSGIAANCPVPSDSSLWLLSPRAAGAALVHGIELDGGLLGANRIINLPGLSVTAAEMVDALRRVAGDTVADRVTWERDERIEKIVGTWPAAWDITRAVSLGFQGDTRFDDVIRDFIDDRRLAV
jgi:D-erythronate 2-dehydrogenase